MTELSMPVYLRQYSSYKLGKVPLKNICFDYRDDITFRIYYLMTGDEESMEIWSNIPRGRKHKRKKSFTKKYIHKILKSIIQTVPKNTEYVHKTKFDWSTSNNEGQILRPVPFSKSKEGLYYPAGGMGRLMSAYFLGHRYIPALIAETKNSSLWHKDFGVTTRHFNGMPENIINNLLFRRKINNLFSKFIVDKKNKRPDFLYEIKELAIRGKYSISNLINDKKFIFCIKNKKVLNLTLDNGWLDINISKYTKSFVGSGDSFFVKIATLLSSYYKNEKCKFIKYRSLEESDEFFDIIIYNKTFYDERFNLCFKNKKIIYDKEDCVIYG